MRSGENLIVIRINVLFVVVILRVPIKKCLKAKSANCVSHRINI